MNASADHRNSSTLELISTDIIDTEIIISNAEFTAVFEYATIGMALVNVNGRCIKVNKSLCEMLGYTSEELMKMHFPDFTHPDDLQADLSLFYKLSNGEIASYQMEKRYFTKDERIIWVNLSVTKVVHADGSLKYCMSQIENINERKIAELELKTEKIRLENVVNATNIAIWEWNVQTGVIKYNERWVQMLGYKLTDLEPINTDTWRNMVHPEDSNRSNMKLRDCFELHENHYKCECRMLHKDGHWIWVLDTGEVVSRSADGKPLVIFGTHTDITEIKNAQEELIEKQAFIQTVLDTINIGIVTCDEKGKLTMLNKATEKFHGLHGEPITSEAWTRRLNLFHTDGVTPLKKEEIPLMQALKDGYVTTKEIGIRAKNTPVRIVDASGSQIKDSTGAVRGAVVSMQDITVRKNHEQSLQQLNIELARMNEELAESNKELEHFAYVASHDLQEPLRMVISFLSLIENKYAEVLDEKGKKYIHYAVDGAERMKKMIYDLLEFSKAGSIEEEPELVNLNLLLKEIASVYKKQIEDSDTVLHIGELPEVTTYKTPLRQVFQNLLSNAIKYRKENEKQEISITAKEVTDFWQFEVKDNGIGIDSKYLNKIFIIFQRLHNKKDYSGTGIGLAIVERIIGSFGGRIWVESEIGKGSSFFFTIKKEQERKTITLH